MSYETVIGLEVHIQLSTKSKIFFGSSTEYGKEPNSLCDPVTLGMPGALPVVNKQVIENAIKLGLALNCQIRKDNRFARKHYMYPDLPKGYQISQFEEPICEHGKITIKNGETTRIIGITRIHMEEDAGKNIHDSLSDSSLVDLNRAGVPLLECVSEPDLRSSSEAVAYLKALHQVVMYLGISDGNMDEGSFRCDANISLRPLGSLRFGTRTEIKNINSYRYVEKALEYEVARQLAILKSGGKITQETLLFNPETGETRSMRGKEDSADYRYFPDPDLPPLKISDSWINSIKENLPIMPEQQVEKLTKEHGLSEYDARVLSSDRETVDYFNTALSFCNNAKRLSNWICSELFAVLKKDNLPIQSSPVAPENLGKLIKLIDSDVISGKIAKVVFEEMFSTGENPEFIVEKKGLKQLTDDKEILNILRTVFESNPKQLEQYLGGKDNLHGFFVGQVMKLTKGSANPKMVNQLLTAEKQRLLNKSS